MNPCAVTVSLPNRFDRLTVTTLERTKDRFSSRAPRNGPNNGHLFMKRTLTIVLSAVALTVSAQRFDAKHPPDTYRNADNPFYWKNRPPDEGYWQQDVHYRIQARLDDEKDQMDANLTLDYWNNSPDTLRHVFFHLYQNAYEQGSYMYNMDDGEPIGPPDPQARRGTDIKDLTVDGKPAITELDNTVMRVEMPAPLAPGARATFRCTFTTYWGGYRRMKVFGLDGREHFDGTHWYPRISVYDRQHGWDTYQHLGNELYGDFGTFDVDLDMPNDMVVEATGWLQNPAEVMPPHLRTRLDITNFKDKPWNERASVITEHDPAKRKVWKYHAENVHDFAFTADPTYRIGETEWNGVKCVAVVQERHASGWQNAADYCAKTIASHSRNFGMYAYPKMVVADAMDGMEYPMLTLDGGSDPDYRGLFVHEIGHNWFYGMVGNNETYRAMLDEGFTQFLTSFGLEDIDGDTMVEEPRATAYERRFARLSSPREEEVYYGYLSDAIRWNVPPINTHSDGFGYYERQGMDGYGHVYAKTATMLYNLQYVLGDTLFQRAMQAYFHRWKICHPTVQDFRNSIIQYTHVDLNWFFDQWIDTDKRLDYAVKGVRHRGADAGQEIRFERKGDMEMPIDFRVTAKDGRQYDFHIPNGWYTKSTTARVLPRWIGHDDLQRTYIAKVDIPGGIDDVRIDTSYRLADAYQLNNTLRVPFEAEFDHHVRNRPDRRVYEGAVRPDVWWNGFDGVKAGVHFHSNWMRYKHRLWLTAWVNTGMGQHLREGQPRVGYDAFNFNLRYDNGTEKLLRNSGVYVQARVLDGLELYGGGFTWKPGRGRTTLYTAVKYMLRRDSLDLAYLVHPAEWEPSALNAAWDLGMERSYDGGGVKVNMRNTAIGGSMPYAQVTITNVNEHKVGRFDLRVRGIVQFGTGSTPRESQLYLAGASPEDMMENKYLRSAGFTPYDWTGYGTGVNHLHAGGGLGLRGYAGYLAPALDVGGGTILTYRGNTGAAINAEVDVDRFIRLRPKALRRWLHMDAYFFGDIGSMGYRYTTEHGTQQLRLAEPRADAGAGVAITIRRFGPLTDIKPLTIRFDVPVFLSHLPAGESEHFAFRYVVGINRTF